MSQRACVLTSFTRCFNITSRISKWTVLAAPRTGQDQSFRIVQSVRGRPCYMYARSLPVRAANPAATNSQQRSNALRDLMDAFWT